MKEYEYVALLNTQRAIIWSVDDFENVAKSVWKVYKEELETHNDAEKWQDIFIEEHFLEALDRMIQEHDANVGITNDVIEHYLNEYCV